MFQGLSTLKESPVLTRVPRSKRDCFWVDRLKCCAGVHISNLKPGEIILEWQGKVSSLGPTLHLCSFIMAPEPTGNDGFGGTRSKPIPGCQDASQHATCCGSALEHVRFCHVISGAQLVGPCLQRFRPTMLEPQGV